MKNFLPLVPKILLLSLLLPLLLTAGEFRIAATTDLHGSMRGAALLAPLIRKVSPDITLDAGDLTGGDLLSDLDGGISMIRTLNQLGCRFRVPGNHDFDTAQQAFARQCRTFKGVTLGGDWSWGKNKGVPYAIVSKGKFRAGIIGLTEPDMGRRHLPIPEAPRFQPWEKVLRDALRALRREKVDFVILLWHNGVDSYPNGVKQRSKLLQGVDLIIAGHSHQEHAGIRLNGLYLVQPGAQGSSAALVTVHYNDATLKVEKISSRLLKAGDAPKAKDIEELNKAAAHPYHKVFHKKVCRKWDLSRKNFPKLGAEALKKAGKTQGAVFVANQVRKGAEHGQTFKDLFRLLPYRNTLCTVELSRQELKALLEDLHKNNPKFKRMTGVAGFRWTPGKGKTPSKLHAPERITLTVNSYSMTSSPVLRQLLREKKSRWRHLGVVEREVVEQYLAERLQGPRDQQGVTLRSTNAVRQGR